MSAFRTFHGQGSAAIPAEVHTVGIFKLAAQAFHGHYFDIFGRICTVKTALQIWLRGSPLTWIFLVGIIGNINHMTQEVLFMPTQRIAITIPPPFLKRLDEWAEKMGKSRSRFIVEELDNRLRVLEDEEITRVYNEVCTDSEASTYDHELAEEMLTIGSIGEEEEKW